MTGAPRVVTTVTASGTGSVAIGGDASANIGLSPFADSYLSLTVEDKYHGFSDRGGIDPRVNDPAVSATIADGSISNAKIGPGTSSASAGVRTEVGSSRMRKRALR